MPVVAGKGYPYTKKGQADAKKAAEKYSKRGKRGKGSSTRRRDSKQETSNQSYKMKIKPKY